MNFTKDILLGIGQSDECFFSSQTEQVSRSQFYEMVRRRSIEFSQANVHSRTRIPIYTGRKIEFFIDLLGLWAIGAVPVLIDDKLPIELQDYCLKLSKASTEVGELTITKDQSKIKFCDYSEEETGLILFTSGSTGVPKGVPLSYRSLKENIIRVLETHPIGNKDTLFINIPFRFISSISHFLSACLSGSAFFGVEDQLSPKEFLNLLVDNKITIFGGAPTQVKIIEQGLKYSSKLREQLRLIMSSGDNLPVELINRIFKTVASIKILVAYGLTEVGGRLFLNLLDVNTMNKAGVGKIIRGCSYKVFDESNVEVETDVIGKVLIKTDLLMSGYLGQGERPESYFDTGDLGLVRKDGVLELYGRSNDVFKVSGLKVSTLVLNEALEKSGLFDDVASRAIQDATLGTVPEVIYAAKSKVTLSSLREHLSHLPSHYFPRSMKQVEIIPRTGSGKIKRKELDDL